MTSRGPEALVFDFDGVLVESTEIKTQAYATIYGGYGADIAARAVEYHLAHAGVSRDIKFRHLHRTLLGVALADAEAAALGERFSALVMEAVIDAPWVAGAREFVENYHRELPLFIASGTPDSELRTILVRRGMQNYFRSAHGAPATKGEIISGILRRHHFAPARVVVVGDALEDLNGAKQTGVAFIGRAHGGGASFPPGVSTISDLTELAARL